MANDLLNVCKRLWELDRNRFKRGEDYEINLKGPKLFSFVDDRKLANMCEFPTYAAFIQLLDNYEPDTLVPEEVTGRKTNKSRAFLNRCLETTVMDVAHSYLSSKELVPRGKKAFKEFLYELWFDLHPRPNGKGTERSAFKHVFVGETSQEQVLGFHNWVQLYLEERKGNVIYDGYYPTTCDDRIITIYFTWENRSKTVGSFFLGTSPEFELAIYTVCFLDGDEDETQVVLGNRPAIIVTYDADGEIGACYPKLEEQPLQPERRPDHVQIDITPVTQSVQNVRIIMEPEQNSPYIRETYKPNRYRCNCTIL
ncbi:hypothetical protein Bbelb_202250 [Branchiostoma belcheri]|nr:hypothetical protein Bbelb_202250 [Branchiostoma belcheri]